MNKQFFPKYVLSNCSSHIYIYRCGGFTEYGYPKSCILIGFSLINHPFWGFLRYPHLRGPFGRVFSPSKRVFPCTLDTVAVVSIYIYTFVYLHLVCVPICIIVIWCDAFVHYTYSWFHQTYQRQNNQITTNNRCYLQHMQTYILYFAYN